MKTIFVMAAGAMLVVASTTMPDSRAAARSCSDQNNVCIDACMKYGLGRERKMNPHPMPAGFCRNHCAGWYAGCHQTGCWNGDLVQMCGLTKG